METEIRTSSEPIFAAPRCLELPMMGEKNPADQGRRAQSGLVREDNVCVGDVVWDVLIN